MKNETVKGFSDFIGADAKKRKRMIKIIQSQFELYGFEPAETPIIEFEEFVRGENKNDEAVRDIFKLEDRGKRNLGLRYEFTFQLKRISKNQKLPYKRFQMGPIFRDEPIRKGRLRQFIQCDADVVGSTIKDEAEILSLGKKVFEALGVSCKIYINNRKLINEILVSEKIEEKNRDLVIREIDKLDKLSKREVADNLKKIGAEKVLEVFTKEESFYEKFNFYKEIKELKKYCKDYGFEVEFRPFLARGLSYYNGTVFEVWSDKLNVAISSGGSYLIDKTQSTGISFGLEPLFLLSDIEGEKTKVEVVSINRDLESINLAEKLRKNKISVCLIMDKTPAKSLEYANSRNIENIIFVGETEIKEKKFKIKNMKTGEEKILEVDKIIEFLS